MAALPGAAPRPRPLTGHLGSDMGEEEEEEEDGSARGGAARTSCPRFSLQTRPV